MGTIIGAVNVKLPGCQCAVDVSGNVLSFVTACGKANVLSSAC
jgi:hypothetical protein